MAKSLPENFLKLSHSHVIDWFIGCSETWKVDFWQYFVRVLDDIQFPLGQVK